MRGEEAVPEIYRGDIVVIDGSRTPEISRAVLQFGPILSNFRNF